MTLQLTQSNRKTAKKLRQIHRKHIGKFFGDAMKPKPKWIPWRMWFWMMSFFIKIDY